MDVLSISMLSLGMRLDKTRTYKQCHGISLSSMIMLVDSTRIEIHKQQQ